MSTEKAFKSILVPVDMAQAADDLIKWGVQLSERTGAKLTFMTVGNHLPDVEELRRLMKGEGLQAKLISQLSALFAEKLKKAPKHDRVIRLGNPVTEILEFAATEKVDLILVGSHHKKGFSLLGSVADGVSKKARCPVLVVRGNPRKFNKIGVALDGDSPGAKKALHVAAALGKSLGATLVPLSLIEEVVLTPLMTGDLSFPMEGVNESFRKERKEARAKVLKKLLAAVTNVKISAPVIDFSLSLTDDFFTHIKKSKLDLLVMSAHRTKGLHLTLIGRHARDMMHKASVSVLIVHQKDRKFKLI